MSHPVRHRVKRLIDLVLAGALLVFLAPLIALIAVAVKLESRGPVFYRCERVGRRGAPLWMLKFRKMHDGASGSALTVADDERFTRVGRGLARLKLDELPQLWHVLRGEMSIVGPRPEDKKFVRVLGDDFEMILMARPGIIGLSQLAFAEESQILDTGDPIEHYVARILPQKARLDTLYVTEHSLLLDLRILLWSVVAVVLRRDVAVDRSTLRMSLRRR